MTEPRWAEVEVGDELPPLVMSPVTRRTLAIYCGASGDHNPLHVDTDFARAAGLDDVIAHGMLVMAHAGRLLTRWVPQTAIRSFETRFLAATRVGDSLDARGRVVEKFVTAEGEHCVRIALTVSDQHGQDKTSGSAVVALA
jgi:acyl dehydratase